MVVGVRRDDEGRIQLPVVLGQQPAQVWLVGRWLQSSFLEQLHSRSVGRWRRFTHDGDARRVQLLQYVADVVAAHVAASDHSSPNGLGRRHVRPPFDVVMDRGSRLLSYDDLGSNANGHHGIDRCGFPRGCSQVVDGDETATLFADSPR